MSVAQFDALAPYHPTSEGVLTKLQKRPYHERSMKNKNIAAIFAGKPFSHYFIGKARLELYFIMTFRRVKISNFFFFREIDLT